MGPMDVLRRLRSNGTEAVGRLILRSEDDDVTSDDDIMGGDIIGGTGIIGGNDVIGGDDIIIEDDVTGGDDIIEWLLLRLLWGWRLFDG